MQTVHELSLYVSSVTGFNRFPHLPSKLEVMVEAIRSWTFEGAVPLVVKLYKPALTIQCGDGPEAELTTEQFKELSERFVDVENFFDTEDPETL